MTKVVGEHYLDNKKQHLPLKSLGTVVPLKSLNVHLFESKEGNEHSLKHTGNDEAGVKPPSLPVLTMCFSFSSFTCLNCIHTAETQRAAAFHSLQLHPLKENDVPLEVGVCLAAREMADLGRVIDWKSGVCHSTLVLRGVIHSRLLREASAA